jgi:hypothetical protein
MSKRFYCDRCGKELNKQTHAVVEVARKRYDLCKAPCFGAFEPFRAKVEAAAKEGAQDLRRRIAGLEDEFWGRIKNGPETKADGSEEENR